MNAVKPITPEEALEKFKERIPDFVIESVNELLSERYSSHAYEVTLEQSEIMERILSKDIVKEEGFTRQDIFDKNYLDFELLYQKAGWNVEYNKPTSNETFKAYFTFRRKALK